MNKRFGDLDAASVNELTKLPCVFAYEAVHQKAPKFGLLREVIKRQDEVRISYEIQDLELFLNADDLASLTFELDIGKWELNRTHWAVKDVNLPKELLAKNIKLPEWTRQITKAVDISTHTFDVALSFPGESRALVESVAHELERLVGPNSYFYDANYTSQLARPSLDTLLQDIYRHRSKLIVVFLGSDYQKKNWCGIEFRAIREIILEKDHKRIMFVRTDDGIVDGVFKTNGYIDARNHQPSAIARFIVERMTLI